MPNILFCELLDIIVQNYEVRKKVYVQALPFPILKTSVLRKDLLLIVNVIVW